MSKELSAVLIAGFGNWSSGIIIAPEISSIR
jgi:hypothetical protein